MATNVTPVLGPRMNSMKSRLLPGFAENQGPLWGLWILLIAIATSGCADPRLLPGEAISDVVDEIEAVPTEFALEAAPDDSAGDDSAGDVSPETAPASDFSRN